MSQILINPIGYIDTPFKQKFAIPRQPNLANAKGVIKFIPSFTDANLFKGLDAFSHVWLLFHFHKTAHASFKPTVKAPRLGGNKTLGVFASRSTFRPNSIGMSVVRQSGWFRKNGALNLTVHGVDLLDGTPIIDIKPYLPYADSINNSSTPFSDVGQSAKPERVFDVVFSLAATSQMRGLEQRLPDLQNLIVSILSQDPRPAYKNKLNEDSKVYAVQLYDVDVFWCVSNNQICVEAITPVASKPASV